METSNLANRNPESLTMQNQSSMQCLADQLLTAATMTNKELTKPEIRLWKQILSDCSSREIEHCFMEYFKQGKTFMPLPGEIRGFILQHRSDRKAEADTCKTKQMLKENREARETGKTVSFGEILQRIKKIATEKAMPTVKDSTKQSSTKPSEVAP